MTRLALLLSVLLTAASTRAQPAEIVLGDPPAAAAGVVAWTARAVPVAGRRGEFAIELTGSIADGWRVYGMESTVGRPLTVDVVGLPAGFALVRAPAPTGRTYIGRDDVLEADYPYFARRAAVVARVRAGRGARAGRHVVRGTVRYAACDDRVCLPPRTVPFQATLTLGASR